MSDQLLDQAGNVIDTEGQGPVSSTVEVTGNITVRTYADGSVQRNIWETPERAQEYADSVAAQEH